MRNAIANTLVCLTIALLPVYNRLSSVDLSRTSKDNLFLMLCGIIAIAFKDSKRDFPLKGWAVFAVAFLFVLLNQHKVESIMVMFHSFYWLLGACFFIRFYECFENKYFSWILNSICIGILIQAVVILANGLGYSPEYWVMSLFHSDIVIHGQVFNDFGQSTGTFSNTNMAGGYIGIGLVAFTRKKWLWFLPIAILALLSTKSIMGIATGAAGLFYYYRGDLIKKKWLYLLASVSMLLTYFTGLKGLDDGRFVIWRELLASLKGSGLLIGNGVGWFSDKKIMLGNTFSGNEHSGFMTILSVFGLMGLFTFAHFLYKYALKDDKYRIFSSIVFASFCNAYGHFSVNQSTMMIIILVSVAICAAKEENNEFSLEW